MALPLPAATAGLQQGATRGIATGQRHHPCSGHRHRLLARHRLADQLHASALRHVPAHHITLRPGRLGRLRLLCVTLSILLGPAPLSDVRTRRNADPLGAGRPEDRRARSPGRDAGSQGSLVTDRPGLLMIIDKGLTSKAFERPLSEQGITLLRLSHKKEVL